MPALLLVGDVVVYEESGLAPEDVESSLANTMVSEQFPTTVSNSTAMVVIKSDDVSSAGLRDLSLQLEEDVAGELQYLDTFTSVYSVARDAHMLLIPSVYPAISETEVQVNLSASLIFGGPSFYIAMWGNNPVNMSTFNTSWSMFSMGITNTSLLPLLYNYSFAFWVTWVETFNPLNVTYYLDPMFVDEVMRADAVIDIVALPALGLYPPQDEMDLFMTGVWAFFGMTNWTSGTLIHSYSLGIVASYMAIQDLTFLENAYALGPNPNATTVRTYAEQVISTGTIDTYPVALPTDVLSNLMDEDAGIMLIVIGFTRATSYRESDGSQPILENVDRLREITREHKEALGLHDQVLVTGDSALEADLSEAAWKDVERIDPITIALVFILIGIFFLSIVAPAVPVGGIGIAVIMSQGLIVLIGTYVAKVHFSILTLTLTIMLGAGTDYAIFLMARYREERMRGKSKEDSVRESVTWAGESVATSGVAVMISFGALSLGSFSMIQTMGLSILMGVGLALVVAITLIPSILMVAGDRVFWPGKKRWDKPKKDKPTYFRRASAASVKHAKAIVLAAILISIPAVYGVFTLETSFDFIAAMPETEATRGLDVLGEGFGKGKIMPTYVVAEFDTPFYGVGGFDNSVLDSLEALSQSIEGLENVVSVVGPTRPQGQTVDYGNLTLMNQTEAGVLIAMMLFNVGQDNSTALLTVNMQEEPFSVESVMTIDEIRTEIRDLKATDANLQDAQVIVGGGTASIKDISAILDTDFQFMSVIVVIGIFILLLFVLGSVLLPLRLILTILLSISWTIAVTMLLFQVLIGIPVLWMMPWILFVVAMGLGMDYDIFLTTRIREEVAKGKTDREAIVEAVEKTGGIITAAGAVMAGAFGSMMLSSLGLLQEFGFALFFAIILDAMIVRIYLVPAIMVLLEKWNWWAPGRLQRVGRDKKR